MINYRRSKLYEDLIDDYISSKNKTETQKKDITDTLNKYLKNFKEGIKLKNGSIRFEVEEQKYSSEYRYIITFKDREFTDWGYDDNFVKGFINDKNPGKRLSVEVGKILFRDSSYSDQNYINLLDFLTEICEKDNEIKECFNNYYKYSEYTKKYQKAKMSRMKTENDIYNRAEKDAYDKAPDISENAYALWHSKGGDKKVTVLSIDEPNNSAKIYTDKGATRNVSLDTLDKDMSETKEEFKKRLKDAGVW